MEKELTDKLNNLLIVIEEAKSSGKLHSEKRELLNEMMADFRKIRSNGTSGPSEKP